MSKILPQKDKILAPKCYRCGQPIPDDRLLLGWIFCSKECGLGKVALPSLASPLIGISDRPDVARWLVALDLVQRDFAVYRAFLGARCDLLAQKGAETLRVLVRCAYRRPSGSIFCNLPPSVAGSFDTVARVLDLSEISYDPSIE